MAALGAAVGLGKVAAQPHALPVPGWPARAGCHAGTHTDGITRVVDEHGLCHVEAELLCETRQAVVKVFQIRFAHGIHVQCYHPGVSHFILPPPLHHSSLSNPTCHLNGHKCLHVRALLSQEFACAPDTNISLPRALLWTGSTANYCAEKHLMGHRKHPGHIHTSANTSCCLSQC